MSLHRFVYYAAVIGGWTAFLAWTVAEPLFFHWPRLERLLRADWLDGVVPNMLTSTLVGAGLGVGLILVSGMANAQWRRQLRRAVRGLVIGGISGAIGGLFGQLLYLVGIPRMVGWMMMGLGIGSAEGILD